MNIPKKSIFSFDEVVSIADVKPYVLRFWETEFSVISPIISSSGDKIYEPKDIRIILLLKKLLIDDGLTVEETKSALNNLIEIESNINPKNTKAKVHQSLPKKNLQKKNELSLEFENSIKEILTKLKSIKKKHNWI